MRGGSRYGAGRPGWNGKVESLLSIDVGRWASEGYLSPNTYFGWSWTRDGGRTATIGVRVRSIDTLALEYGWTPDGEDSQQSVTEVVPITYTPCHYGGTRPWFLCPRCRRRVAKLYLVKGHWYCRKSLNVRYSSQSEDVMGRMHRKIAKLENRLGEYNKKPKRMHTTTYHKIL